MTAALPEADRALADALERFGPDAYVTSLLAVVDKALESRHDA